MVQNKYPDDLHHFSSPAPETPQETKGLQYSKQAFYGHPLCLYTIKHTVLNTSLMTMPTVSYILLTNHRHRELPL